MEDKNDADKIIDDVMLPGFRFHPTDEELVGFYLKRKLEQRSLPIELIKQVDIYKYDPWDLPKLASTGEKEWYFYCPRDRKYRNSTRPNRVTGSGFWKATGTDRPIYSSNGTHCIGLKKSLVFYRGRAAKGLKTDWMMHEFRLPSTPESGPPKKLLDKKFPLNDSWAICRIFKKTNSMAQRALSQSWITSISDTFPNSIPQGAHLSNESPQQPSPANFSDLNCPLYKPPTGRAPPFTTSNGDILNNFMFLSPDEESNKSTLDVTSMMFNSPTALISERVDFTGGQHQFNGYSSPLQEMQRSLSVDDDDVEWGLRRSVGFPFNFPWDSPPCPSAISTTYSPNK